MGHSTWRPCSPRALFNLSLRVNGDTNLQCAKDKVRAIRSVCVRERKRERERQRERVIFSVRRRK